MFETAKKMTAVDVVKLGLKGLGTIGAFQIGKEVAEKTTATTGFMCGVAVFDMNRRAVDTLVDSAIKVKNYIEAEQVITKVPGEPQDPVVNEAAAETNPDATTPVEE